MFGSWYQKLGLESFFGWLLKFWIGLLSTHTSSYMYLSLVVVEKYNFHDCECSGFGRATGYCLMTPIKRSYSSAFLASADSSLANLLSSSTVKISGGVDARIRILIPALSGFILACPVFLISSSPSENSRYLASFSNDRTSSSSRASGENWEQISSGVKDLKGIRRAVPLTAVASTFRKALDSH